MALDPAGVEVRCIVTKVVRMEEVIFDGEVPINASACVPVPVPTDETAEFLVEYHVRLPDHTTLALEPQRAVVQDEL